MDNPVTDIYLYPALTLQVPVPSSRFSSRANLLHYFRGVGQNIANDVSPVGPTGT